MPPPPAATTTILFFGRLRFRRDTLADVCVGGC